MDDGESSRILTWEFGHVWDLVVTTVSVSWVQSNLGSVSRKQSLSGYTYVQTKTLRVYTVLETGFSNPSTNGRNSTLCSMGFTIST